MLRAYIWRVREKEVEKSMDHTEPSPVSRTNHDSSSISKRSGVSPSGSRRNHGESLDSIETSKDGKLRRFDLEQGSSDDTIRYDSARVDETCEFKDQFELEKTKSARSARTQNLVTWDSPVDKCNPKQWSFKRKWAATIIG